MSQPRLYNDLAWIWPFLSPPEDYEEEADAILDEFTRLGLKRGSRVLHLGSGGGSLDFHLKAEYAISGLDLSEAMIEHATRVNPEVHYLQGDLIAARLNETFDGVLLHDAIAYLTSYEELQAAFRTAAEHLEPGGALVCQPEQIREHFLQNEVRSQTHTDGHVSVTTVEVDFDPERSDDWFETTFAYFIREGVELRVELDRHWMGLFPLATFARAAQSAGFEVEAVEIPLSDMPEDRPYTLLVGRMI